MNKNKFDATILCGQIGMGKTFFSQALWSPSVTFQGENPISRLSTLSVVEVALSSITAQPYPNPHEMVLGMKDLISKGYTFIVDNAEKVSVDALALIINTALASNADHFHIVFIFDVPRRNLLENEIYRTLLEWNVLSLLTIPDDFISTNTSEFILENIPSATPELVFEIESLTGKNFNLMIRLIWLHQLNDSKGTKLSQATIEQYTNIYTNEMLVKLPDGLRLLLRKSSIIGEVFSKKVLESPVGFNISGVKAYLDKIVRISSFIDHYVNDDLYKFESGELFQSVLDSVEPEERVKWTKIVINYYLNRYHSRKTREDTLPFINKLAFLSSDVNDKRLEFLANCNLLFEYSEKDDADNILHIFRILTENPYLESDRHLRYYITVWMVRYLISKSLYEKALEIIKENDFAYAQCSNSFTLLYYKAFCLFNCGNVDESYTITAQLCRNFVGKAEIQSNNSPVYALTFSLMATLQNHFGIEDSGLKYYALALNHAHQRLEDQTVFYDILKKADMFYAYPISCDYIEKSISYFSNGNHTVELGELYFNLATEILFQDKTRSAEAKEYLDMAMKAFINLPNERLAYAYNNLAIFFIVSSANYIKATQLLEEAMFVGMSDFTYMTLHVNLCMCYLKVYGAKSEKLGHAYTSFEEYYKKIKGRQNATQYEEVYKRLIDQIIYEYSAVDRTAVEISAREILSINPSPFFLPIIEDMILRASTEPKDKAMKYKDNSNYYLAMNRERIFLAEFRFWE